MEQTLNKLGSAVRPRLDAVIGVASVAGFVWLLAHDLIHPLTVLLLQLYLAF